MLVTCPSCQSVFKLANNDNPNLKMRCSICSTIFAISETKILPDNALLPKGGTPKGLGAKPSPKGSKSKKRSIFSRLLLFIFFVGVFLGGLLWNYTPYLDDIKEMFNSENIESMENKNKEVDELFQRVRLLELADVRQFVVPNSENDKFKKLTVIEGKVVNNFDEPRSFIELEATLYDAEGNSLGEKSQMAGPKITFFQLQVLGESELEQALQDNLSILNYNTNIKPKGSVPFTFIFYNPPETAANFNVKITNAQIPESEKTEEKAKRKSKAKGK